MTKVVSVRFINEGGTYRSASRKTYDYFYEGDTAVEKDDIAVVDSPYGGIVCTIVVDVRESVSTDKLKSVIGVVSRAEERNRAAKAKRAAELRKKIQRLVDKHHQTVVLRAIAEEVVGAAELIKELEELDAA